MIRPRTTVPASDAPSAPARPPADPISPAPSWQEAVGPVAEALLSLVAAVESQPTASPDVKAFQAAIRRKGEEASAAGRRESMEAALRIFVEAAPNRAERRDSIVDKAWAGLPDWRS